MAAPNSGESAPAENADDRTERIAALAAQLALIQARGHAGSRAGRGSTGGPEAANAGVVDDGGAGRAEAPGAAGAASPGAGDPGDGAGAGGRRRSGATTRRSGTGGAVPIGSSGTTPRQPVEPGGHPEDELGDPEAVAKAICLRLLTGQARPRAGLAAALHRRGIPDDVAGKVLDRFTELGLIDDRAYAELFVAAKHRDRALGATALRNELRRKGVDVDTVEEAVRAVDRDAERDRAVALIDHRIDAAMVNGIATARRRLVGLLARRGYSAEVASSVVEDALADYALSQPAESSWLD